jgi:4-diphosphocytidyl-2-C-methyl-D-erythritol kinase
MNMIGFSHAKINLGLFVLDKRADGFHNLESAFWPVDWTDVLEIHHKDSPGLDLKISGRDVPGNVDDNLISQAYGILQNRHSIGGVSAHLHKVIPMGAGLGGGSSNATCMLRLLNQLFELNLTEAQGLEIAAELGSDCPFFWNSHPALVTGRGEYLQALPDFDAKRWADLYITIIHPGVHVSTAKAFSACTPDRRELDWTKLTAQTPAEWNQWLKNDFEEGVSAMHPEIHKAIAYLGNSGAEYVQMTGTGSAAYGIYQKEESAAKSRLWALEKGWSAETCSMGTCL